MQKDTSKHLWQSLFLVKYLHLAFSYEYLCTDAFALRKLFSEKNLILDVKTALRLQKPYCLNFWWKHIKNESCKWYLDNKEQKAVLCCVYDAYFGFQRMADRARKAR